MAGIRERGLLEAIVVWRDEIIDGRHRALACLKAGVEPAYRVLPDDADPLEFVLAKNGDRRDMSISQRAVSAYRLSMWSTRGRPRKEDGTGDHPSRRYTQGEAAKRLGVSRRRSATPPGSLGRIVRHTRRCGGQLNWAASP